MTSSKKWKVRGIEKQKKSRTITDEFSEVLYESNGKPNLTETNNGRVL